MELNQLPSTPSPNRRKSVRLVIMAVITVFALAWFFGRKHIPQILKPEAPPVIVTTDTVRTNDVFATMLLKHNLDRATIFEIQRSFGTMFKIPSIRPGHKYEVVTSTDHVFQRFRYWTDPIHFYTVVRSSANVYSAKETTVDTVWKEKRVQVEITKFIEADLRAAGYDSVLIDNLSYELGESIFGWRIDFFTEQRKGDTLDVLLEEEYLIESDKPLKGGRHMRVLIASYTGSGTKVKENIAVRYQAPDAKRPDYFDADGRAMRRQFLRAPFTKGAFRISSRFNPKRFHPILRVYRPHHGTDYAASVGTPVAAIGNGTVVRAEWYKGYGNCVDIRHNNRYISRYGHLSRIAVRRGQSVAQGQYIGNVGNTGLSTGPHLHFEMLVDGQQRNFLGMNFPAASSVSKENMADFSRVRDALLQRLKSTSAVSPTPSSTNADKAS